MVVYPRWRGELNIGNGFAAAASGLSPLARGALREEYLQHPQERFIPAGAGNTIAYAPTLITGAVYPRWCGEHRIKYPEFRPICGLSPRARGTLSVMRIVRPAARFIPAGAGNTYPS